MGAPYLPSVGLAAPKHLAVLDSARVRLLELRQPLDMWYVRHVEVAARYDDGVESLLPPLVVGPVLALLP
jgi:hypothetical protein